MKNPQELQQNLLLARIIDSMENLNQSVVDMNKSLQEINRRNMDIELSAQLWENYLKNVNYDLERTGEKTEPI